jgi:hypothetical protein
MCIVLERKHSASGYKYFSHTGGILNYVLNITACILIFGFNIPMTSFMVAVELQVIKYV